MKPKVFAIDRDTTRPPDQLVESVGNKAFNLMRLAAMNLPVPPAFVLSTGYCQEWTGGGDRRIDDLEETLTAHVRRLENLSGLSFGDERRPLLLSVRSGAAASMPGMMDTLLNVGLTPATLRGAMATTGNPRLAWDSLRRLVQSFAETVYGRSLQPFHELEDLAAQAAGVTSVAELNTVALRALVRDQLAIYADVVGESFPDRAQTQLLIAVEAVFRSWDGARARTYRKMNHLDGLAGTAVTVQQMVFGNAGSSSGAGVGFTRDPATGEKKLLLEFLFNAQGEDVVSGRYQVQPAEQLRTLLPEAYQRLASIAGELERAFQDVQDFEFTVEEDKVYLLQTRRAKRTPWAALKIAVALAEEGMIAPSAAEERLAGIDLDRVVRQRLDTASAQPLATAKSAGIGVATGRIALQVDAARKLAERGEAVILVRTDTTTDDVAGMAVAEGILTSRGGRTSHAAVVARQMGKLCLVGCDSLIIAADEESCTIGGRRLLPGDQVTLDGDTGAVYAGALAVRTERPERELAKLREWRDQAGAKSAETPTATLPASRVVNS